MAFGNHYRQMAVLSSMGMVGDAFDNLMAESFFTSLECELIDHKTFKTRSPPGGIYLDRRLVQPQATS
ncbi:hypothetical protein C8R32_101270 [Nitrosospira sp. Nsp5]|nr:hypothetical protein C8R32_101270 [Nitrosospira sp. Nsp5]